MMCENYLIKCRQSVDNRYKILSSTARKQRQPTKENEMIKQLFLATALIAAASAHAGKPDISTPYDFKTDSHRSSLDYIFESRVADNLKDPNSAIFTNSFMNSAKTAYCGLVNSKNSYGGYTGNSRWMSTGDVTFIEGNVDPAEFNATYKVICI